MPALMISWVVIGLIAGLWTFLFSSRRLPGGAPVCMIIGIVASSIAGYLIAQDTRVAINDGPITVGSIIVCFAAAGVALIVWKVATRPVSDE